MDNRIYQVIIGVLAFVVTLGAIKFMALQHKYFDLWADHQELISAHETNTEHFLDVLYAPTDEPYLYVPRDTMVAYVMDSNSKMYLDLANTIVDGVIRYSRKYGIPPSVLLSLIKVESTFNPGAESNVGARGLTQVMPSVWVSGEGNAEDLVAQGVLTCKKDLFDPEKNIHAGAYVLGHYLKLGMQNDVDNPVKYALTRYYGGAQNAHYSKTMRVLGDLVVYDSRVQKVNKQTNCLIAESTN